VAAAAAATHGQLSEFAALQDEKNREHDDRHREHEANHGRVQRALGAGKSKRNREFTLSRLLFLRPRALF